MVTAKNSVRIRTRNYADWKLLKNGCRESPPCDDSDVEPEVVTIDRPCEPPQGLEHPRAARVGMQCQRTDPVNHS